MLSAAAFASMSLFIKWAYSLGMSVWSFTLLHAGLTLLLLALPLLRDPVQAWAGSRAELPWAALFAVCGAVGALAFNLSLVYLSISLATILLFTYPALVAGGAWLLLGHRPSLLHMAALLLTLVGAAMTTNLGGVTAGGTSLLGISLAGVAAIAQAFYIVAGERLTGALSPLAATALTRAAILVGTLAVAPGVLLELPSVSWTGWLLTLLAALLAGATPFLFLNRGIALIGANRAAIASVAELPIAMALGLLMQGDRIFPSQWLGALLVLAAVLLSQHQAEPSGWPAEEA